MVVDLDMDRPRAGHETSQHGAFSIVCILLPLTWFKVPLEITRSGSGRRELICSRLSVNTTRVPEPSSLTSPDHFSSTKLTKFALESLLATLPRVEAPQGAVHRDFVSTPDDLRCSR